MFQYHNAIQRVLELGELRKNRTGIDTISLFGHQMFFDLRKGFPAVTTKNMYFKSVVAELLWFLRGETNTKTLGAKIWSQWADSMGTVRHCYGEMWRRFPAFEENVDSRGDWEGGYHSEPVDQIAKLIEGIEKNPNSRRHIVSAWHPQLVERAGLPWCHVMSQFNVTDDYVDCAMVQRSADLALGVPFNIASYALLLSMVARRVGRKPRMFVHTLHDMHIYVNHVEGLEGQLKRRLRQLPELNFNCAASTELWDYKPEDIELVNYDHDEHIPFEVAV